MHWRLGHQDGSIAGKGVLPACSFSQNWRSLLTLYCVPSEIKVGLISSGSGYLEVKLRELFCLKLDCVQLVHQLTGLLYCHITSYSEPRSRNQTTLWLVASLLQEYWRTVFQLNCKPRHKNRTYTIKLWMTLTRKRISSLFVDSCYV